MDFWMNGPISFLIFDGLCLNDSWDLMNGLIFYKTGFVYEFNPLIC